MRDNTMARAGARSGGVPPQALALLLCGTALFLAVENAVLLFMLGPSLSWPAELEGIALTLRVVRILAEAFAPWLALGMALTLAGATGLWAVLRIRNEVNHA